MVSLLGLLEELQVVVELALRLPRRAIDAGQLRALLVAAPVSAGDPLQLESLYVSRRPDVGTKAQVQKIARAVDADAIPGDLVRDQLELVVLPALAKLLDGLLARQNLMNVRNVCVRQPPHA